MAMLRITDLHKSFGDKQVLKGLELTVPEGSIFGFIGKNGAGKTTAMKTVLGLLRADRGEITVGGERVVYGQTATNRLIGYLPDVPEFYPFMTAGEYLAYCGRISGLSSSETAERSRKLLALVGLGEETHRIKGFSRGMKQRLGIAQALLSRPKLLLCDEPTSALDPVGRKEILDILLSVREQTTVLFSTHILSDVERICTDVALLDGGCVKLRGKLSEIKSRFGRNSYRLEVADTAGAQAILGAYPLVQAVGERELTLYADEQALFEVLGFISSHRIPVIRVEREEATLESLFMEVART